MIDSWLSQSVVFAGLDGISLCVCKQSALVPAVPNIIFDSEMK